MRGWSKKYWTVSWLNIDVPFSHGPRCSKNKFTEIVSKIFYVEKLYVECTEQRGNEIYIIKKKWFLRSGTQISARTRHFPPTIEGFHLSTLV